MARVPEPEPLRRVSLHLFEEDVQTLTEVYGYGWTKIVREAVRSYIILNIEEVQDDKSTR